MEKIIRLEAARCARYGRADAADLAQIGRLAAFRAWEQFDVSKGAAWKTWASRGVRIAVETAARSARPVAVSLDSFSGDDDGCLLDGLPADWEPADERLGAAEREVVVRRIVARVRAEFAAKKQEAIYDAVVARLLASVEVVAPTGKTAVTSRSEITLASIAASCGCSRQWAHKAEATIKARLAAEL